MNKFPELLDWRSEVRKREKKRGGDGQMSKLAQAGRIGATKYGEQSMQARCFQQKEGREKQHLAWKVLLVRTMSGQFGRTKARSTNAIFQKTNTI
mmetsp:Transcript_72865/g.152146  ORF Transcript_72865/g.152146 Transcript_72865/m.152146 type:complete len:95 (+) Transcript_72865:562-846(+)